MTTNARDLLIAAPERWDETCFAVPAIRAMMATGMAVGVFCHEERREFWETLPGLEIVPFAPGARAKTVAPQLRDSWRAALVWEPGLAADAFKLADLPRRIGPAAKQLAKQLTHPVKLEENPLDHRVRFYLSAVEVMEMHAGNASFFAPAELGVPAVAEAVLLSPDSDFGRSHEWPLERWLEIAGRLRERNFRVTVAGLQTGRGETLADKLGDGVEFFEASPLAGVLPLLAVHGLVVAADSSLPHLAAHAGATCVTLFGPNDPQWKRPLGRRHTVVRRHVECAPCLLAKCPLDLRCQNELETDRVWSAVMEKLKPLI